MLEGPRQRLAALADQMTLAQQIAITMGALFVLSLAAVAFLAASISRDAAVRRIEAEMKETALTFADRLEMEMRERLSDLSLLAASAHMRGLWTGDPTELRTALEEVANSMGHEAWVGFVRPNGTVAAATQSARENESVASEPWFRDALDTPMVQDLDKPPLPRPQDGAPLRRPGALLALPVRLSGGETAGALVAHLSLGDENKLRESLIGPTPEDPSEVWLLSRSGEMLMGPRPDSHPYGAADVTRFLQDKSGTLVEGEDGEAVLTGFAVADGDQHAPFVDWIVVARQPAAAAFEEARQLATSILAVGLLVLILAVATAILIARRIARPLSRLADTADEVGRSPAAGMLPRARGSREVVRLSGALRALLRRVGVAEAQVSAQSAQHAKDMGALKTLADTDPLTGLLNRRAFHAAAARALGGTRITDRVGVLMVDLDHFKAVNDSFGHAAGDAVLAAVGRVVSTLVRGEDKAARFGGEEFVVLSLSVSADELGALAERLRAGIAAAAIVVDGRPLKITASIGATLAGPLDRDIDDVIERADMALYAAKRTGRDRTVIDMAMPRLSA